MGNPTPSILNGRGEGKRERSGGYERERSGGYSTRRHFGFGIWGFGFGVWGSEPQTPNPKGTERGLFYATIACTSNRDSATASLLVRPHRPGCPLSSIRQGGARAAATASTRERVVGVCGEGRGWTSNRLSVIPCTPRTKSISKFVKKNSPQKIVRRCGGRLLIYYSQA